MKRDGRGLIKVLSRHLLEGGAVKSNTAACITAEIRIGYLQDINLKLEEFGFIANICGLGMRFGCLKVPWALCVHERLLATQEGLRSMVLIGWLTR